MRIPRDPTIDRLLALERHVGNEPEGVAREARGILHQDACREAHVRARLLLADVSYRRGDVPGASSHFQAAEALVDEADHPALLARALVARAARLGDLGRTGEALEAGMRARRLAVAARHLDMEAHATQAIAWTLLRARDHERAEVWIRLARDLAGRLDDPLQRYTARALHASWLKDTGRPAEALALFERALDAARPWLDHARLGAALANLGECLADAGRHDEALGTLARALEHVERAGHRVHKAGLWLTIGRTHLARGDAVAAVLYLEHAAPVLEEVGHKVWLHTCLAALSSAWAARGDAARALALLQRSVDVERATVREQRATAVGEIEAREAEAEQRRLREELSRALADVEAARLRSDAHASAISAFLAVTSHEIRTPLTGVLGVADLLAEEPLPAAWRESVDMIRASGRVLLGVVNDILDFNRLAAGRLDLDPAPCVLPVALESALLPLGARAREKHIALTLAVDVGAPWCAVVDDRRLAQVVANLAHNAVRFTEQGGVEVHVAPVGEGCVRISVTDTGPGLDAAALARVFQPFVQADRRTSREHGGSGLGLAICRQLVDLFHGHLGAESAPGQGSTFWVEVPLEAVDARAPAPMRLRLDQHERIHQPAAPTAPRPHRPLVGRVLVVEDNIVNQRVVTALLGHLGADVEVVDNGPDAVSRGAQGDVDVILMDGDLPGFDGWEATRRLRALGVTRPILALTASLFEEVDERCRSAGMSGVIAKPVTRDELLEALAPHLGTNRP